MEYILTLGILTGLLLLGLGIDWVHTHWFRGGIH